MTPWVCLPLRGGDYAFIDAVDCVRARAIHWRKHHGVAVAMIDGHETRMHRYLLNLERGRRARHVNGDRLDNRRCNIRASGAVRSANDAVPLQQRRAA